jgi:hypothetical protein
LAYFTLMASVAAAGVDAFRQDTSRLLHPSLVSGASHLLSHGVQGVEVQPLNQLLNEAVDGGELLHTGLWHPLRPPKFHCPPKVRSLADQVEAAWEGVRAELPQDDGGWFVAEVSRLLHLYWHAATTGECVVTALDSPGDKERARRVRIPWKAASTTGNIQALKGP